MARFMATFTNAQLMWNYSLEPTISLESGKKVVDCKSKEQNPNTKHCFGIMEFSVFHY